ncbi:MAG TPA: solute carrier family 23 protein, partial [Candidatus Sulfotelmatobacter sp.]|nr:solute carrier family 23 protein [Candidatus Sulfotelmatobacter sp.]
MLPPAGTLSKLDKIRVGVLRFTQAALPATPGEKHTSGERRKPANLIYDVDEVPPLSQRIILALQHVFVISVGWIFVVVMTSGFGGTAEQAQAIIRVSMVVSGIATILQARARGPVGSGYLCPFSCGPAYLGASILAGKTGGLSLVFGLTTVSGVFETLMSRMMKRLRVLFPPEVTGLVVAMVGIELIGLACPRFVGNDNPNGAWRGPVVALLTLIAMVAPTVWSKGRLRLYPVILGLTVGYAASLALGLLDVNQFHAVRMAPLVSLPGRVPGAGWSVRWSLVLPFLITSVSSILKTVGDLTLCEKINDADWKRTDMKPVSGGILSGSLCTILAGVSGGMGQSTFSSNVGLSMATGATSRSIALPIGLILILLAFFPKLAATFAAIPQPVMGAVLVYVACFTILGGMQVLTSRMLDARKTFVIGIALVFGLSVEMVPGLYHGVPTALQPLFASSLSLSTVLVVALNLLMRIGIASERHFELTAGNDGMETIVRLMEQHGATWGMRKEVASRAAEAIYECNLSIRGLGITSPVSATVRFNELV